MSDLAAIIEARSTAWMAAWVGQDRAVLEDSLAPDFALIVSAMPERRMERALWLATCDRYVCSRFAYRGVQVRELAPGLAVMSAIGDQQARMGDVDRSGAFFLTDVWRLEPDGAWRVCARYSAHPEPAGASSDGLAGLRPR
ncbi:nuclear transport factor 2 family protein [Sphingomonas sp.]|uniref:nuclear transport factor 2 family protein n=1 Tax=Sphingomonas sp. TaxID=28214 RepID=UPI0025D88F92|nr:nuclear transport factor 2 family protein [Sphingomonas sp.]MBV9527310.1 nuclear transport factor 2 family protein [Sphingomonas sp.]